MTPQEQGFSASATDQNSLQHSITDENHRESLVLFEYLSPAHSSLSMSSPSMEDIDRCLQCGTDNVDVKTQTSNTYFLDQCFISEEKLLCAERRIPSKISLIDQSKSSQAETSSTVTKIDMDGNLSSDLTTPCINHNCVDRLCCDVCGVQFSSGQALSAHIEDKHFVKEEVSNFVCITCGKALRRGMKFHERNFLPENDGQSGTFVNPCPLCSHVSKTKRLLKDHIARKHSRDRKIFRCSKCSFSCLKPGTFSVHMRRHVEEPKFACDQCGKLFLTMSILKRHANTHNKTRQYFCHVQGCGKSFNIKGRLTDHVRTVHNTKKASKVSPHKSKKANNTSCFNERNSLSKSKNESGQKKVQIINQVFVSKKLKWERDIVVYDVVLPENEIERFQNHTTSSHSQIDIIMPEEPNVSHNTPPAEPLTSFKREEQNAQISSKEDDMVSVKPDSIGVDGQCMESYNKQRPNFVCSWDGCGKKFRDSYNLRMHMCTHTGEMQRACTLCRYRCVQKSALDSHMLTHFKKCQ